MLVLGRRAEETLRPHCSLFFVPGLSQVKPLHSHSRYLARLPMCPRAPVCRTPSATFLSSLLSCLTLSLCCFCLSPNLAVSSGIWLLVCTCLFLCLPDVPSPSVAPCPSVCPQGGACKGRHQYQHLRAVGCAPVWGPPGSLWLCLFLPTVHLSILSGDLGHGPPALPTGFLSR